MYTYRDLSRLIYDWNVDPLSTPKRPRDLQFLDETLRDGLQSASVRHPSLEEKVQIIRLMEQLGINSVNLGMAFASEKFHDDVVGLAQIINQEELFIEANSPSRMIPEDIDILVKIISKTETPIEVCAFIASSPIRVLVEGWKLEKIIADVTKTITRAVDQSIEKITFVTVDTTRSAPEVLKQLLSVAVENGANRIALCDTVGHATPQGTKKNR